MKFASTLFYFFIASVSCVSQSNFSQFKKLSSPKKWWVVLHPFKAQKAYLISVEVNGISDSIKNCKLLDGDHVGGQVDAFRHAYWMARLTEEIGASSSRSLGKAHEKENYLMYKNRKLEDGIVPDKISSEMDLFNNEVGISLTRKGNKTPKNGLIYRIINAILDGKMKVIKKNISGQFLTCEGKVISSKSLIGKWKNNKCLVNSSYIRN
ncbi:hypothetical protein BTO06_16245 [Tenacibaculum sp. SZ-18]|uniref:DUF6973 domain-containing protein n=1 Tax=Tenacibaculum sp. SZ-18 TaxID=754423 RepID=UPI000C2D5378|nr:hypothetical protein [Tenacibaculum sp. SZ-18]AUC16603.1 hypothetical protein BTO06_16245 [Tenacibaculum sp. SZ-18]